MFETIASIATGNVVSAIGIIRISGDNSLNIADRLFFPKSGKSILSYPDHSLVLGELQDASGNVLDSCLCTISRAPNSYTGENTAELQCHGSPTVLRLGLEALFSQGARQALAGEFTKRAFLNGRMDLTQAEAVIDLIEAETGEAAKNAAGQLGGAIMKKTDEIYNSLVDIISHYHAVIDYPDEDIEDFQVKAYESTLTAAGESLSALLQTFDRGRVLKNGVLTAIIGRPNAGKSSLMNALLGYDRAIVTDIPGTTRDTIQEKITLGGVLLRLSDTAGLRGTADPIEQMGVDRALRAAENAELVLAVFDGSEPLCQEDFVALKTAKSAPFSIAVINKSDLSQKLDSAVLSQSFELICPVSALDKTGLEALSTAVSSFFPIPDAPAGEILTNARHEDAVSRALISVREALQSMESGATPDIILTEAENSLNALGELSGKTVREDVTHRIFDRFCVGK